MAHRHVYVCAGACMHTNARMHMHTQGHKGGTWGTGARGHRGMRTQDIGAQGAQGHGVTGARGHKGTGVSCMCCALGPM